MWPHHKFPCNANTPSLTTMKALHITMATYQFVSIITKRHSMNSILNYTLLLTKETRKLKQCWIVQKLPDSEGPNQTGFPLNKSLQKKNKYQVKTPKQETIDNFFPDWWIVTLIYPITNFPTKHKFISKLYIQWSTFFFIGEFCLQLEAQNIEFGKGLTCET